LAIQNTHLAMHGSMNVKLSTKLLPNNKKSNTYANFPLTFTINQYKTVSIISVHTP